MVTVLVRGKGGMEVAYIVILLFDCLDQGILVT